MGATIEMDFTEANVGTTRQLRRSDSYLEMEGFRGEIDEVDYGILDLIFGEDNNGVDVSEKGEGAEDFFIRIYQWIPKSVLEFRSSHFKLMRLLRRRIEIVDRIGKFKSENGIPFYDEGRERRHIGDLINEYGQPNLIPGLFGDICDYCRKRQETLYSIA